MAPVATAGAEAPIMPIIDPVAMPLVIMAAMASGVMAMEAAHSAEWLAEPAMVIDMVEPDIMAAVLMGLTASVDAFPAVGAPIGDAPHPAKRAIPRAILIILIERLLTRAELPDWLSLPEQPA